MKVTLKILNAKVQPSKKDYRLSSKTYAELKKEVAALTKKKGCCAKYHGAFEHWFKPSDAKPNTEISEALIQTDSMIEMPVWTTESKASKSDQANWQKAYKQLLAHEQDHHKILVADLNKLKNTLEKKSYTKKEFESALEKARKDNQVAQNKIDPFNVKMP